MLKISIALGVLGLGLLLLSMLPLPGQIPEATSPVASPIVGSNESRRPMCQLTRRPWRSRR